MAVLIRRRATFEIRAATECLIESNLEDLAAERNGSGELLRLRVQEFEGEREIALYGRGAFWRKGLGFDGGVRTERIGVRGLERGPKFKKIFGQD